MQAKKAHQLLLWGRGEETKRNSIKFEGWIIHYFHLIPLSLMIIRNWPIPDAFSRKHWELTLLQKYPYFRPSLLKSIPNFRQRGSNLPMAKKRYSHWESILWKIPRVINWKLLTLSSPSQGTENWLRTRNFTCNESTRNIAFYGFIESNKYVKQQVKSYSPQQNKFN